jgi:hypothetical protein
MAIRDLLWACPLCAAQAALHPRRRGAEQCASCGASFRRGPGADIIAETAGGSVRQSGPEWLRRLPPIIGLGEGEGGEGHSRATRVEIRRAIGLEAVHAGGRYLGAIERLGPSGLGRLELTADTLSLAPAAGQPQAWSLAAVCAVQPSSSTLQLKLREEPVISLRFLDESVRFWEELLQRTLAAYHRRGGKGEILEFQPRIVFR